MAKNDVIGIDVSRWQQSISWQAVAKQVYFALIKASENVSWQDPYFVENWRAAKDAGLARGAYHFFRAHRDPSSARRQADWFFSVLSKTGDLGEISPIIDVETNDEDLTREEYEDQLWRFCDRFEGMTGRKLMIYTSRGKWDDYIYQSKLPLNRDLWVANYQVSKPTVPVDWSNRYGPDCWKFWQFTSKGSITGITGSVDMNHYNGTLAAFNKEWGTNLKPIKPAEPPTLPPGEMPEKIRIVGLQGARLNMRDVVWGDVIAQTFDGAEFGVEAQAVDTQDRMWYQVGKSIWLASWYTEVVE